MANSNEEEPSAVGLTIYLDKIVAVLKEDKIPSEYVVVCSIGNYFLSQAKQSMARKLWEAGIKCYVEDAIEVFKKSKF